MFSKSYNQHLSDLQKVFNALNQHHLRLKIDKCHFFMIEMNYLGFVVSRNGIHTDPQKVKAIKEFPIPNDVTSVRSFLGVTGYYRKFVPNYANISRPLYNLITKSKSFEWTDECNNAFNVLKDKLICSPILSFPNFRLFFILTTDASKQGLSAILSQVNAENKESVICYSSRTLRQNELNYHTTEVECLALVWDLKFIDLIYLDLKS